MTNYDKKIKRTINIVTENKYTKFIAIGVGLIVTIYVGGKVCKIVANSVHGYKDLKRAIQA